MRAQPMSEQLAERLEKMILDGEYAPGEKLANERELSERLGVSRTMLREATKQLAARGLLEVRRGVGTFVSDNPGVVSNPLGIRAEGGKSVPEILEDWYRVRMIVESEAMEMAAEKATDEEIAELEEILAKELELARTDYEVFMDTDRAFHCALAHATHNLVMARLIPTLHASIYYDFVRGYYPQLRRAYNHNVNEYHVAIVRHLKLRDGRGANLAMRCHMLQGIHDLRSTIKE